MASWLQPGAFTRFLGNVSPLVIFSIVCVAAVFLLHILGRWNGFDGSGLEASVSPAIWHGAAFAFVIPAILVDTIVPFPPDMNVRFPQSVFFYPAIGFLVEVLFHLLPCTLLLLLARTPGADAGRGRIIWIILATVALIEPAFQAIAGASATAALWRDAWVAWHIVNGEIRLTG